MMADQEAPTDCTCTDDSLCPSCWEERRAAELFEQHAFELAMEGSETCRECGAPTRYEGETDWLFLCRKCLGDEVHYVEGRHPWETACGLDEDQGELQSEIANNLLTEHLNEVTCRRCVERIA